MDCRRILFLFISLEIFLISGHTKDILEDEFKVQDDLSTKNYRLPTTMHPTSYEIFLFPKLTGNFSFQGEVKINVRVDAPTKFIVLHQGNLFNVNASVSAENKWLEIEKQSYDKQNEKYNIELKENLEVGNEILLYFTYDGYLRDDMIGFYKSSYMTDDNRLRWLATTQFQTTHARHAFLCFDEPGFKATFKISLIRSKEFNSISNMPLENTKQISSDLYLDTFETTVPMSTYLVAFAIFDFHNLEVGMLTVWARPDVIHQTYYASKIGSNVLMYLTNLFEQEYELPKMDMVAVPDFSAGAMENWGLITYRESQMLYDENESSIVSQQNVASVIVHEITHMWFGNLLTPSWWSYLWLSEGFARYFQYFGTAQIEKTWSMEDQFLVEQYQAALGFDGIETSRPMTRDIVNQSQVSGSGDSITYSKGASIIRMMSYIVGIDKFYEALRIYIRENKNVGIVEPKNLWVALQKVIDSSNIDIETIMNNWTKKPGFPVLTVIIEKGKAKLHQKRFLLRNLKSTSVNETWSIPITYTTKKQVDFKSIEIKHWMKDEEKTINVDVSDSDWIVFNVQQAGFYRVNYDNASWYRIIDTLKSDNFKKIHVYNRAGIIDDLLNLARTGLLDYRTALDGLQYLKQEKNYLPFKAAFRALDYLTQRFSGNEVNYVLYKKYVLSLIEGVYQTLGYVDRKKDDRLTVQLRRQLNDLACKFGHEECVSSSLEYFRGWINAASRIEPNQRSAAYCMGVLYGNADDWNYLWNHYKTSKVVSEQLVVLSALGCSNNTDILKQYLQYAISPYENHRIHKQDSTSVFSSVYSSSLIGVNCVLEFIDENHDKMAKYYGGYDKIASILSGASQYLSTKELIDKFERLIKNHSEFTEISKSLMNSLELAKYELIWYTDNVDQIVSWIKDNNKVPDHQDKNEYRLPGDVVPKKYVLSLEPFLDPSNFTFSGNLQILAVTTKKTNRIVLHASDITIYVVQVLISNNKKVNISQHYKDKNDFFVIELEQTLDDKTEMTIVIRFLGKLNEDRRGFYRSYYIDKNGKKRWLAATQLAPIGARKMFPCFDEPAMKAVFSVDVLIPYDYHPISNTKIVGIKNYTDTRKYWYTFEETELMSTYLLALIITDFNYMNNTINEKNFIAWASPNTFNQISYAFSLMEPFVKTYEQHLKHNYTLNKLDIVSLSDLAYGAMENWGLLTFREDKLLFHSNESNIRVKQTVTTVLSHEIAHQWFGNLVSPLWWNYIWLNEGFATYFEYFGTSYQKPEWELEWQFVVEKLHSAFKSDALASSHAMTYDVQSPTEIRNIYDSISYAKAASVIRMIEKTYGSDVFYAALHEYLEARKFSVATPEDLYAAISSQLPDQTSASRINKFLDSWTTQVGYPVVNVTIDSSGWATLSQERFFLRNEKGESVDKIWQIPITWTSEKDPNFENTKPQFWLTYAEMRLMTDNNVGWKIFNVQQAGYYRVNYDSTNWKRIIDVLKTGKFEKIHKVNRAALIDDLMNLARAGYVDYGLVFSATEYLQHEKDYLPWRAFFNGLTYLHNKFEGKEVFSLLKKHVRKIMFPMDLELTAKMSSKNFMFDLLEMETLKWACKYNIYNCFEIALIYLRRPEYKVPVNERPSIYCVWATNSLGWNTLWELYLNSTITSEKLVILNALGCSEDTYNLHKLLSKATTNDSEIRYKDSIAVFASIYENSLTGVKTVMKFMEMKFDDIYQYYNDESAIKTIMSGLAERISTKQLYEQYTNLTDLITMKIPTLKNSLKSYRDLVLYEFDWYKRNIPQISYYLEKLYPNNDDRLPTILHPLNYNLSIAIRKSRNFEGSVKINIQVDKPTFQIVLNSHKLNISKVNVYETPNDASQKDVKYFEILDIVQIYESQKLIIYLKTYIEVKRVTVELDYIGEINTQMKGLYQYNDMLYKTYNYLATYFKPNYARMVFPCFDEPSFKAKFKIHILRPNLYKSLSNTALERSLNFESFYTWDIYKESQIMSTYLLAFVISDFQPVRNEQERLNVWARKNIIKYGDEAQYTAHKLYKNIEYLMAKLDKLEKIDIVGMPNFPVEAMESWGLPIFKESQLFYDRNLTTLSQQYSILTTIAHVISHEYFGNFITCEWWSYSWLNEGLAQYFQWLIAEREMFRSNIKNMFVVNDMHDVLNFEDLIYTRHSLSAPKNLRESFDKISYKKGASIIRMLHMLVKDNEFYYALYNYANKNKNGVVNPSKLWEAFQPFMKNNISLETTMNEWVNESGYPIVYVNLNSSSGLLKFSQDYCRNIICKNTKFHIPISMATELNPNFKNTTPQFWLTSRSDSIQTNLRNNWVVINVQQIGYYRVRYDTNLMNRIIYVLKSEDYGLIHVINRAQIIDDIFSLGIMNKISLSKAFQVSLYLRQERAHLPWKAFERNINNLWEHIRGAGNNEAFKRYVLYLTDQHVKRLGFNDTWDDLDQLNKENQLNRELILSLNCKFGGKTCIYQSNKFGMWQYGRISPNVKPAILCTIIKHGNEYTWINLWSLYKNSNLHTEELLYLDALGCTENDNSIFNYLQYIFNKNELGYIRKGDIPRAFASIYKSSEKGWKKCYEYMMNNYLDIYNKLGDWDEVAELFTEVILRIRDNSILDKFIFFVQNNKKNLEPIQSKLFAAIDLTRYKIADSITIRFQIQIILEDILHEIENNHSKKSSGTQNLNIVFLTITSFTLLFILQ